MLKDLNMDGKKKSAMKRNLIVLAALSFLAASCAQKIGPEQPENLVKYVPMTFTVEGQGTRSALDVDGRTVVWTSGDMISLFDDIAGRVPKAFAITAGKVSVIVTGISLDG